MRIILQAGHCQRKSGATGTEGEQAYAMAVCREAARRLGELGHATKIILADDYVPSADAFVAVHGDGSTNRSARGISFGYRSDLPSAKASKHAGEIFLRTYQRMGYPGGIRPTNGTPGLAQYYGCGRAGAANIPVAIVIEGGFLTNDADRAWMTSKPGIAACAQAIVAATTGREADLVTTQEIDMTAPQELWGHPIGPGGEHMAPAGNRVFDTWAWVSGMRTTVAQLSKDVTQISKDVAQLSKDVAALKKGTTP
jgi:N-acetylmuramoyl-L-alanine amidase